MNPKSVKNQKSLIDDLIDHVYADKTAQDKQDATDMGQEFEHPTPSDGEDFKKNFESKLI